MSISFEISQSAKDTLQDITVGLNTLLAEVHKKYKDVYSCCGSLADLIFLDLAETSDIETAKAENKDFLGFCNFLARASVLAYLQKLDNDKDIDKLRESGLNIDFKFGYTGLVDKVLDCVEVLSGSESSESHVNGCVETGLLASVREIEPSEYKTSGKMSDDIIFVAELGNKTREDLNLSIKDFIKRNEIYNKYYEDTVDEVLAIYKYFLQDSFGLRPYEGVLSFNSPYFMLINNENTVGTQKDAKTGFTKIANELSKHYDVIEKPDRQFDVKTLITGKYDKPVYFPNKLLEYAMGRELTYELSKNVYKVHASSISWDNYSKDYVENQIREILLDTIYYTLEYNFKMSELDKGSKDTAVSFISDEFKEFSKKVGVSALENNLGSERMQKLVRQSIIMVKKSLCTGVAITKYNNLGSMTNCVSLRIVDTTGSLKPNLTASLFGELTTNEKVVFANGDIISAGKMTGKNQPLPYDIYEFRHDFNEALSSAEPLFGYKAVEMFKARGVHIGWSRILLGEDIKGTPLFASLEGQDDLPVQTNFVHNLVAGTRAGKGVMTMNILASAVAENKPIFYIDRKPDMAILFKELSGGSMFVINGGADQSEKDPEGFWGDDGKCIEGWKTAYDNMPSYIKENYFPKRTYIGDFGDMVYFRAMLFVLCIVIARVELKGNPEIYENLGGANGIVAVFDEFLNWQLFEKRFFSTGGIFGNGAGEKGRLSKKDMAAYDTAVTDIELKSTQLSTLDPEKKQAQIVKLEMDIKKAEKIKADAVTPIKLYSRTLMDKYGQIKAVLEANKNAGFHETERKFSDLFVIGQSIETDGYHLKDTSMFPMRADDLFKADPEAQGKSLMRGILDSLQHDWFMGYNQTDDGTKKYIGANESGSMAEKWVTNKRYWAYINGAEMSTLRSGTRNDVTYFNPYLVLNKHYEDDPNARRKKNIGGKEVDHPDFLFVNQCRDRVNEAVPNLWETIRLKHLRKGLSPEDVTDADKHYNDLNDGIGFEGLARQTKEANGNGSFDAPVDLARSGKIANYVANCMGYPDYQTLIFDFSPMGLFDSRDMIDALKDPQAYASNTATRLPLFAKYGFLDAEGEAPEEPTSSESSFSEDPYANGFMSDDEDTESSGSEEPSNTEEEVYETEEVEEDTSESAEFNNSDSEDGGWYEEGDEPEDDEEGWYSDDEEEETQSGGTSNLPFTREELAEALVVDIAPQFEGMLKQKAIEMVLELFEQRGVKL